MAFGWKVLIPARWSGSSPSRTIRAVALEGGIDRSYLLIGVGVLAVALRGPRASSARTSAEEEADRAERRSTPFAGGYPVPPMPGGRPPGGGAPAADATPRTTATSEEHRVSTSALAQGAVLGPGRGVRGDLPDDVQEGRHRAVPVREEADRAALPRPAPAQPLARRAGEVHRLRAVRLGLPGRRDLRRGRRQHRRSERVLARASATAASTRSTTCAASCAGCASRRARPGR